MITRALLLSSSRQPYRRGGLKIGPRHDPTRIAPGDIDAAQMLAIVRDRAITLAWEIVEEDGPARIEKVSEAEREAAASALDAALTASAATTASDEITLLTAQLLDGGDEMKLQPPSGASGNAEGDASASGAPGASGGAPDRLPDASINPPGNDPSSAEGSEQSRETADASAPDRKVDADEGKQPEETSLPPVAEPDNQDKGPSAEPAATKPAGQAKPRKASQGK